VNARPQRFAVEQLHDDEPAATVGRVLADVVDRADVRMIERRGDPRLALEALEQFGCQRQPFREELQRDVTTQARVFGFVNDAHAAGAKLAHDAIVLNLLADHGWIIEVPKGFLSGSPGGSQEFLEVRVYEHRSAKLLTPRQFVGRMARHLGLVTALVVASLAVGMAGYMTLGRMQAVDAFLNSAMLLGGMGPVGDLPTDAAKVFAGVYALYAGLVFIASATILIAPVAHRVLHKLHVSNTGR